MTPRGQNAMVVFSPATHAFLYEPARPSNRGCHPNFTGTSAPVVPRGLSGFQPLRRA